MKREEETVKFHPFIVAFQQTPQLHHPWKLLLHFTTVTNLFVLLSTLLYHQPPLLLSFSHNLHLQLHHHLPLELYLHHHPLLLNLFKIFNTQKPKPLNFSTLLSKFQTLTLLVKTQNLNLLNFLTLLVNFPLLLLLL